ncbi:MAG: response regulator, partial [Desulfovermiculus sp.]
VLAKTGATDLVAEHAEKEKNRQGYPDFSGTKARILVAEDNVVNQQVALGLLKRMGLRADAVANGREAVHALENIPYDLVLMDVQMPEMDGLEATRRIRGMEHGAWGMEQRTEDPSETPHRGPRFYRASRGQIADDRGQEAELSDQNAEDKEPSPNSQLSNSPIFQSPKARIPIIAMTAAAMQEDRERCFEAGMDDYIAKPVNPGELARVLTRGFEMEFGRDEPGTNNAEPENQNVFTCTKPVFDQEDFMTRIGHDTEMAGEILSAYMESLPENIKSLKTFIEQGQNEGATRLAHSIKGSSANTGCLAMSEIAEEMEKAGQSENLEQMKTLMPELEKQFEICMAEIQKNRG